jgi:cytochrome c553
MARWIRAAAILAAALVVPAQAEAPPQADQCGTCHGVQGRSETPNVPSLAGMPAEFITLQMILFREGLRDAPPMPQFAQGLSDAEIERIAVFYAALPPGPAPDRGARDAALMERGAALSARMNCGVCHLPDFRGRVQMPRLAGQREDFLAQTLKEYRDNRRVGTDTQMNGIMHGVADADIAALAHFLAHQD